MENSALPAKEEQSFSYRLKQIQISVIATRE
jgi:hypothetical protein